MTTFTNSSCFVNKWAIFIRMQDIQLPFLQLKANNSNNSHVTFSIFLYVLRRKVSETAPKSI